MRVKAKPCFSMSDSKSPPSDRKCMSKLWLAAGWRATALAISTMRVVSAKLKAQGAKRRGFLGMTHCRLEAAHYAIKAAERGGWRRLMRSSEGKSKISHFRAKSRSLTAVRKTAGFGMTIGAFGAEDYFRIAREGTSSGVAVLRWP